MCFTPSLLSHPYPIQNNHYLWFDCFFPGLGCLSQVLSSSQRFSTSLTHLDLSGNTSSLVTEEATVTLCFMCFHMIWIEDKWCNEYSYSTCSTRTFNIQKWCRLLSWPCLQPASLVCWNISACGLHKGNHHRRPQGPIRCSCNKVFLCTTKVAGLVTCCPSTVKVSEGLPETATLFQDIRWWFSILDKNVDMYRA